MKINTEDLTERQLYGLQYAANANGVTMEQQLDVVLENYAKQADESDIKLAIEQLKKSPEQVATLAQAAKLEALQVKETVIENVKP